jgi:hypothetical protein
MVAGHGGQPPHCTAVHVQQPRGLPLSTAIGHMSEHGDGFFFRQPALVQGRAFAFGKIRLASAAKQQADLLLLAGPAVSAQISRIAFAVIGTRRILATELLDGTHQAAPSSLTTARSR